MKRKPRIGIVGNLLMNDSGQMAGMYRSYVNHNYVSDLEEAGALPVILPVLKHCDEVSGLLDGLDGVLLSGGYDVDPALYGEGMIPQCGLTMREVDDFNIAVIEAADAMEIPVFGICKGIQIMNVAFGGTLYQDLFTQKEHVLQHVQPSPRYQPVHSVRIEKGSFLYQTLGGMAEVNSFHHQAVKDVAEGFKVTARALDGVIEGMERKNGSFMAAVQFHPEMMAEFHDPEMMSLLEAFVRKCSGA